MNSSPPFRRFTIFRVNDVVRMGIHVPTKRGEGRQNRYSARKRDAIIVDIF